jgi:hypothetical protein
MKLKQERAEVKCQFEKGKDRVECGCPPANSSEKPLPTEQWAPNPVLDEMITTLRRLQNSKS